MKWMHGSGNDGPENQPNNAIFLTFFHIASDASQRQEPMKAGTQKPGIFGILFRNGAWALLAAAWLVGRMRLPRLLLWAVTTGALILVDLGFIGM